MSTTEQQDAVRRVSSSWGYLPSSWYLNQVFEQLRGQHSQAAAQLQSVRSQLQLLEREKKSTVLTLREIEALPRDQGVKCYKGVGRM